MRVCRTCGLSKEESQFPKTGSYSTKAGNKFPTYKPDCKLCHNEAQAAKVEERWTALGIVWKCVRCGYDKCRAALEFHHNDSATKDFTIASRPSISLDALRKEVEKCVLLCANCHREVHAQMGL